jgi:deazaflavin-dependent oxidoreductase (nitroreductase family)
MSIADSAPTPRSAGPARGLTRLFNPAVMFLAGKPFFPLYGVVEHRGRRSGKAFHTPVVVRPTADGFIIPMPWGEATDWYRNVRAAGECVIHWKGRDYPVSQPELLTPEAAGSAFGSVQHAMMSRLGIRHCLRLRHR